jgi:hypothetical protein
VEYRIVQQAYQNFEIIFHPDLECDKDDDTKSFYPWKSIVLMVHSTYKLSISIILEFVQDVKSTLLKDRILILYRLLDLVNGKHLISLSLFFLLIIINCDLMIACSETEKFESCATYITITILNRKDPPSKIYTFTSTCC